MTSPGKWGHCHHCFYSPWTRPLPCPKQSIIGCHGSQQEDIARSWELAARSPLRPSCLPSALPCVCLCALGFSACRSTLWAHMGPYHPEKLTVRATVFGADKLRLNQWVTAPGAEPHHSFSAGCPRSCGTHVNCREEVFSQEGWNFHGPSTHPWLLGAFAWHVRVPKRGPSSTPTPMSPHTVPISLSFCALPAYKKQSKEEAVLGPKPVLPSLSALPLSQVARSFLGNVTGFQISPDMIQRIFFFFLLSL